MEISIKSIFSFFESFIHGWKLVLLAKYLKIISSYIFIYTFLLFSKHTVLKKFTYALSYSPKPPAYFSWVLSHLEKLEKILGRGVVA